ncbi:MAG: PPK2 family polyphosphate kinase [Acidimicrobiales bacterium]
MEEVLRELRVRPGDPVDLTTHDPGSTPGAPGDRDATGAVTAVQLENMSRLQERLYAEGRRSLLVVLQGMDCSGKDAIVRHVIRGLNPAGTRVVPFREPSKKELAHDFLWRIHHMTPAAGEIVVFNRSHYEDVTTARVKRLAPEQVWKMRYEHINSFERLLGDGGTRVLKCFLHISQQEQARRLRDRIEDPHKRWKLTAEDIADHKRYAEYQAAFTDMIDRTSTDLSPWWVVPSDAKWYRNWAVAEILLRTLKDMNPKYPDLPPLPEGLSL